MAGDQERPGLTDQGCDGRGEDRAALHHEGHPSTHHHSKVPCEPAERVWEVCHGMGMGMDTNTDMGRDTSGLGVGAARDRSEDGRWRWAWVTMWYVVPVLLTSVDDLLDGFGHLPLEQGVEEFDQEDEAGAEHDEGPGQQHQPHGQVGQWCVGEEVLACPTARLGKGLGPARPRSQTCPHRQPHTWTPAQHLPALPLTMAPALLHHLYNSHPRLHLPSPVPCAPALPKPSAPTHTSAW